MKKIIYITILLFLFASFGLQALAQDEQLPDPGLLPDSSFYFFKEWKEQIQLFFTFGEENKAKQHLHLADVRLAEYEKMMERGKEEIAQRTLEKYQRQLNYALQKNQELKNKGEDTQNLVQELERAANKHEKALEKAQEDFQNASENAKQGLEKALEASRKAKQKGSNAD